MIDDVISRGTWRHLCKEIIVDSDWCIYPTKQFISSHTIVWIQWHSGVYEKTFHSHVKYSSNSNCKIFKILWSGIVKSARNGKLWWLSGRFHTLILRSGDTVQTLESPGLSRRVDSTDVSVIKAFNILQEFLSRSHPPKASTYTQSFLKADLYSFFELDSLCAVEIQ